MANTLIILSIIVFSSFCIGAMLLQFRRQPVEPLPFLMYIKLVASGIVSFIGDALGLGSFAVNIAMAKLLGTFNDEELPAVSNGAQVLPGTLESFFFMQLISVDLTTMIVLVFGTCIGGILGGSVVSRLSKQAIRLAMMACFSLIILLLIGHQFHLLPVGGEATSLQSWKLLIGFFAMIACGALTSVGVGLFVMVQGVLFLLNVSPLVAFPIMTTAGALQQPLTTLVFLKHGKIPLKKTLILSVSGCVGVLITLPIFTLITVTWLHSLLMLILFYNLASMTRAYLKARATQHDTAIHASAMG